MTDEKRQEIMRRQSEGMRAMSNEEMAQRQFEMAHGMRQRGPLTSAEQEAMRNLWALTPDTPYAIPDVPAPTLLVRFKRWISR